MGHKHAGSASQFSLRVCAPYLGVSFSKRDAMDILLNIEPPNWLIQLIIGGFVGAVISILANLIYSRLQEPKEMDRHRGTWHAYFFSLDTNNTPVLYKHKWVIQRGLLHRNKITINETTDTKGVILKLERNHFLVKLEGKDHESTLFLRFERPSAEFDRKIYGICLTYGYDGSIAANGAMLSQDPLSDNDASVIIKEKFQELNEQAILRIAKN